MRRVREAEALFKSCLLVTAWHLACIYSKHLNTILRKTYAVNCKLPSNYSGDYSYSFQGYSEFISITVAVSLFFFLQNGVTGNNSPQGFPIICGNYSYMI